MPSRSITLLVRAVGARSAARDMTMVSRATASLGTSSKRTSRHMGGLAVATGAVSRSMNTLALGVGLAGAAAIKTGIKYNAMMQQQKIAFTSFLGSTQQANAYLAKLYDLAAVTPYEFPDLVRGTRTMLAYGMAADDTYETMKLLGDAIAAAPTEDTANQIARTSRALGQIQAAGILHAQDLNQLVDAGVTSVPKLAASMGISTKAFRKQMALGTMDADRFFKAQKDLWEHDPIYSGMAKKQAETFYGRLSTLHDYTVQAMGSMTEGLFEPLTRDLLPALIDVSKQMQTIWSDKKLTLEQKFNLTQTAVNKAMTPLLHSFEGWWARNDVSNRIETALSHAMNHALEGAGKGLWFGMKKLFSTFWETNLAGKVTITMLLLKFGLTRMLILGAGKRIAALMGLGFGKGKGGKGGLLGNLGGATPVMNVEAGVVNVTGGKGAIPKSPPTHPPGTGTPPVVSAGRSLLKQAGAVAIPVGAGLALGEWTNQFQRDNPSQQGVHRDPRFRGGRGGPAAPVRSTPYTAGSMQAVLGHLATGGMVNRSGYYEVGEKGRERVYLPSGATVEPTREQVSHINVILDGKVLATAVHRQGVKAHSTR